MFLFAFSSVEQLRTLYMHKSWYLFSLLAFMENKKKKNEFFHSFCHFSNLCFLYRFPIQIQFFPFIQFNFDVERKEN